MSSEGVPWQGDACDSDVSVTTDAGVVSSDQDGKRTRTEGGKRTRTKKIQRIRERKGAESFQKGPCSEFTDFHSQQDLFVTPFRWRLLMRACRV